MSGACALHTNPQRARLEVRGSSCGVFLGCHVHLPRVCNLRHPPVIKCLKAAQQGSSDTGSAAENKPRRTKTSKPGPTTDMEDNLRAQGYVNVAGVDEAGRGPLAGPVVVAACVVPPGVEVPGVRDSKQMSEKKREEVYEHIKSDPRIKWAVSVISHEQIDRDNILQATLTGMRQALNSLAGIQDEEQQPGDSLDSIAGSAQLCDGGPREAVHFALVDGTKLPKGLACPALAVEDGDARSVCIAAASVIAKVTRDSMMQQYHELYPVYGFDKHKAYGVPAHMEAIRQHGPCPIHRRSFEPIKSLTGWSRSRKRVGDKGASKGRAPTAGEAGSTTLSPSL